MSYKDDRQFTDNVHNLAVNIYNNLGFTVKELDKNLAIKLDNEHGIDYILRDKYGNDVPVQERFRRNNAAIYTDVTLRYRRDYNPNSSRHSSEFFKIKAKFLVYGILNKENDGFVKFAILNLEELFNKIDEKKISIGTISSRECEIRQDILHCPINKNPDRSSTFVPFDIKLIKQLVNEGKWNSNIIYHEYGF